MSMGLAGRGSRTERVGREEPSWVEEEPVQGQQGGRSRGEAVAY